MADRTGPWQRQGVIPVSRQSPDCLTDPIYESLLRKWREQGRTLPGRPDPEWQGLVDRDPWPRY